MPSCSPKSLASNIYPKVSLLDMNTNESIFNTKTHVLMWNYLLLGEFTLSSSEEKQHLLSAEIFTRSALRFFCCQRDFCSDSVLGGQGRRGGHGSSDPGFNDAANQSWRLTVLPFTRVTRLEPSLTHTHDNWPLVTGDLEERDAVRHSDSQMGSKTTTSTKDWL